MANIEALSLRDLIERVTTPLPIIPGGAANNLGKNPQGDTMLLQMEIADRIRSSQ